MGHTFPSVVFCSFGAFFFSYGVNFLPALAVGSSYAPDGTAASAGLVTEGYNAGAGESYPPPNSPPKVMHVFTDRHVFVSSFIVYYHLNLTLCVKIVLC